MPDFKVIKGGGQGPPDYHAPMAVGAFKSMTIELLRAMVRGEDHEGRVAKYLEAFIGYVGSSKKSHVAIIEEAIEQLHSSIEPPDDRGTRSYAGIEGVIQASLQVAAENCCSDGAAQGRASQRQETLERRMRAMFQERTAPRPPPHMGRPTKQALAADKAARVAMDNLMKEEMAKSKSPARKKRWSPLDSRSYLDDLKPKK